ncbi:hypothetical protein WA026_008588 [Henosepilachna vigintioctopunctata]|uniref:Uncharacterized protein n=1 Tax=Henosepilachna vigintioctopunctata TaxID=420089 RepID=A0AAW1U8K3_9CUCU
MEIILKHWKRRYTRIEDMQKELDWMEVKDMLEMNALNVVHKLNLKLTPDYLKDKLTRFSEVPDHNTRNRNNFMLDYRNTRTAQNSVFFRAVVLYNKLSTDLRRETKLKIFKRKLRRIYLMKMNED